ncbi:hypothetical protein GCM10023331_08260 [Algivirga pacifica]|uniref:Uncharacterized protein n=1 Tax=Algivirga pacifica TaxID=1162670 RepID=A0ABP9D2G4_9BACT
MYRPNTKIHQTNSREKNFTPTSQGVNGRPKAQTIVTTPTRGRSHANRDYASVTSRPRSRPTTVVVNAPRTVVIKEYHYRPYHRVHHYVPTYYAGAGYWGTYWRPIGQVYYDYSPTWSSFYLNRNQYYYNQGVYYSAYDGGYRVIEAPLGAIVSVVPDGAQKMVIDGVKYYYFAGTVYRRLGWGRYQVVRPLVGMTVNMLPEGAVIEEVYGETYYVYQGAYYEARAMGEDIFFTVVPPPNEMYLEQLPSGCMVVTEDGQNYFKLGEVYYEAVSAESGILYRRVVF